LERPAGDPRLRCETVSFLPCTAPRGYCAPDTLFDPEPEIPDSLAVADSSQADSSRAEEPE
jgi:hypothetical protein